MYIPSRFPIYLDIYDMWGAVKILVPEFGLTALLLTSELYRSSLTSGNKGFTTPLALSHFCLGHILSFSFKSPFAHVPLKYLCCHGNSSILP